LPRVYRPSTEALHRQVVERAVLAMHSRFSEEDLRLAGLAGAAFSSPFHLARLFRRIAGVTPGHFLTAVRMQAAKRLLAETPRSVTSVCFDVGYSSVGTFTRRFTQLVGVSPRRYRRLIRMPPAMDRLAALAGTPSPAPAAAVHGDIIGEATGPIVIGLFPTALPQGHPVACAMVPAPGPYRIAPVPAGRYFALALSLNPGADMSREPEFRGAAPHPIVVPAVASEARADITLRRRLITDPPIVISMPLLLAERSARRAGPVARGRAPELRNPEEERRDQDAVSVSRRKQRTHEHTGVQFGCAAAD